MPGLDSVTSILTVLWTKWHLDNIAVLQEKIHCIPSSLAILTQYINVLEDEIQNYRDKDADVVPCTILPIKLQNGY